MDSSSWDDSALSEATAKLDEELEKLFEEVEKAVIEAGPLPESFLPGLEILPDDYEPSPEARAEVPAPASLQEDGPPEMDPEPTEEPVPSPPEEAEVAVPEFPAVSSAPGADEPEDGFPAPDFQPGSPDPDPPDIFGAESGASTFLTRADQGRLREGETAPDPPEGRAADLSARELAELIERAVTRGVLAALKQRDL